MNTKTASREELLEERLKLQRGINMYSGEARFRRPIEMARETIKEIDEEIRQREGRQTEN